MWGFSCVGVLVFLGLSRHILTKNAVCLSFTGENFRWREIFISAKIATRNLMSKTVRLMDISFLKETFPGEQRVALTPASVGVLCRQGFEIFVESGAGELAGYANDEYVDKGATVVSRDEAFGADVLLQVRSFGANSEAGKTDLQQMRAGQLVIGMCDPLGNPQAVAQVAQCGITLLALELIPRVTRAQSMDILSSMATVAGYRAVVLAAARLPRMFPLLMTAAGTVTPARVLVIGAGVAGLQAIATARRLGAVVYAYDVRSVVREQVESLGARFVELNLENQASEDQGGYAKELDDIFYQRQRELMTAVIAASDVVISTAAIPGRQAPILVSAEAVQAMPSGSVIVDLAAERGGNCEFTQPDQDIVAHGVTILGPTNLPSEIPYHASQMFSKNLVAFLTHLFPEGKLNLDLEDEIFRETTVTQGGDVIHPRIRELLKLEAIAEDAV